MIILIKLCNFLLFKILIHQHLYIIFLFKLQVFNYNMENTFKNRSIKNNQVSAFENELSYAGQIALTHPLINYDTIDKKETIILEGKVTPTEAGVTLATLLELCEEVRSRNKGLSIKVEDGEPHQRRRSGSGQRNTRGRR
mgnify:CR=1 FL=1